MSRIGKQPVTIPSGVTVSVTNGTVAVKGPKGELKLDLVDPITAKVEGSEVIFERPNDSRTARSLHGLMRSLASNMVTGVSEGFEKKLEVQGIGYRADVKGKNLVMNLGYSHLIEYPIPADIDISVDKANVITVSGIDKARVGQVAANIRAFRSPDRYKGKGVRYQGEYVALKAGKSA